MPRHLRNSPMPKRARTNRYSSASLDARRTTVTARVWDPIVRIFHWSLVLSFGIAWLSRHSSDDMHRWAGYFAAGLILVRLVWGAVGTPHARFYQFVRDPATNVRYLRAFLRGRVARYV